ncbi:MAG: hypothetical protein HOW73_20350 [Polyangiaceae bacterium]|nr:hypothetical protein [Polyangiaceae bacterium]
MSDDLAIAAVVVAGLFVVLWLRRLATKPEAKLSPIPTCDACRVEQVSGRVMPNNQHDCTLGGGR